MKKSSLRIIAGSVLLVSAAVAAPVWADAVVTPAAAPAPAGQNPANAELRKRQEQLVLENGIADQELHKALAALTAEKQRRELESAIAQQKLQAEIASMQAEMDKVTKQTDLLNKRVLLKEAERRARLDAELAAAREKLERVRTANDLATAELAAKTRELTLKEQELRVRSAELQAQKTEFDNQLARLTAEIDLREKRDQWKNRVNADIKYTKEPFKNGVLTISDRRIKLNGPISMHTADHIVERVNYFNNQSTEFPIFIVIDESPGGSVAAGYKILKTMSGSRAPVYVVVKAFAASMAATITTLAPRSFVYPNAVILHHQILTGSFGNLTEQREKVRELEEWWKRLAAPVAAKMGIGLDEFIKRMYQNRSTGDWREFGDHARKLKWVDEVVDTIYEESYIKNPDAPAIHPISPLPLLPIRHGATATATPGAEQTDELPESVDPSGKAYVRLPRLSPVDCYYLYNPDNYYRVAP